MIVELSLANAATAALSAYSGFGLKAISTEAKNISDLERAREHLARCNEALDLLDDPETPEHVLQLALDFCEIIHDQQAPELLAYAAKLNPDLSLRPAEPSAEMDANERERWRNTPAKSMSALLSLIYEGAEAMSLRWPETAPAFARLRRHLPTAPSQSTREIAHIKRQAQLYRGASLFPA